MKLSALFSRGRSGKNGTHPVDSYLKKFAYSPNTFKSYAHALESIARTLSGGQDTARTFRWDLLDYKADLGLASALSGTGICPKTVNFRLTVYRQFLKALRGMRLVPAGRLEDIAETVKNVTFQTMPAGRELPPEQIDRILDWCEAQRRPKGIRDSALISVLYGGGLRRGEAIFLQLADYRPDAAPELIVRGGKGRKDRALDLAPKFKRRLDAWVRLRGTQPGPLFCPIGNGGYLYVGKLHPQTITDLMRAIAVACGLPHFTPHDLRRSFATHLLDALYDERGVLVRPGFPITVVAELMGHASVKTTMAYYRGNDEKRRRASYSLPGGGQ